MKCNVSPLSFSLALRTRTLSQSCLRITTGIEHTTTNTAFRPAVCVCRDESTVNNEGMGRKSSKRCCIFHKPRAFGESSTDSSDYDSDESDSSSSSGGNASGHKKAAAGGGGKKKSGRKKKGGHKIARPKSDDSGSKKGVPDYQRFHA